MRIGAQEEYGLRCLRAIARAGAAEPITAREIAAQEALSLPYATKLLRKLRQAGLVESVRGHAGGYRLAASPDALRLNKVLEAMGGLISDACTTGRFRGHAEQCQHVDDCTIRGLWGATDQLVQAFLAQWTVADLIPAEVEFTKRVDASLRTLGLFGDRPGAAG